MIRHAFFGAAHEWRAGFAPPISGLAITVIEAAFFGLLMATISLAALDAAGELATGVAAVDLPLITMWADEEKSATAWRTTEALPEGSLTIIRHVGIG
jgi:hypothetical protein